MCKGGKPAKTYTGTILTSSCLEYFIFHALVLIISRGKGGSFCFCLRLFVYLFIDL